MEEKRYPILEEEKNGGLCSEPSIAARYAIEEQFDIDHLERLLRSHLAIAVAVWQ